MIISPDARKCPNCGSKRTRVTDSKENPHDGYLIRYRRCNYCKFKYRTYEIRATEWKSMLKMRDELSDFTRKVRERLDID